MSESEFTLLDEQVSNPELPKAVSKFRKKPVGTILKELLGDSKLPELSTNVRTMSNLKLVPTRKESIITMDKRMQTINLKGY